MVGPAVERPEGVRELHPVPRDAARLEPGAGRNGDRSGCPYRLPSRGDSPDSQIHEKVKQHRLRRVLRLQWGMFWRLLRSRRRALAITICVLLALTLTSRLSVAYFLA